MTLGIQISLFIFVYAIISRIAYLNAYKYYEECEFTYYERYERDTYSLLISLLWPIVISFLVLKKTTAILLRYIDIFCRYFVR